MRLLNATTFKLEEFFDENFPQYAILSHRWQADEVSLQDIQKGTAKEKAGFVKVKLICEEAVRRKLQYVWVDTCCIDKSSSAELSEAINSMYRWYKNAVFCCVFLFDVQSGSSDSGWTFKKSSWWSRGWTLQELIAPSEVLFFDDSWQLLGTKQTLQDRISDITRVDTRILNGEDPELCSIAQRMAWASNRTTTRTEDLAYCLLGIFGVNMPLLYGEGDRAFIRLQEEIMKHSDDHSLFAWSFIGDGYRGLLAQSPSEFRSCHNVVVAEEKTNRIPYSITNMGLSIEFQMKQWAMDTFMVTLDCETRNALDLQSRCGIFLRYLKEKNQMARVSLNGSALTTLGKDIIGYKSKSIYVRQNVSHVHPESKKKYGFWLRTLPTKITIQTGPRTDEHVLIDVTSRNKWSLEERELEIPIGKRGTAGVLWYESKAGFSVMKLGFDSEFNPVCMLGGPAWGSEARSYFPDKEMVLPDVFKLNSTWFEEGGEDWVISGDRVKGLEAEKFRTKISIHENNDGHEKIWIVDIDQMDNDQFGQGPRHEGIGCDGCWAKASADLSLFYRHG
ncbi:related to HET domain protein [Phialocephala subalpina]|uniref:Related to HET domain protein n=1 Tax=Phialocephala subalpina TaxID=576137 RepID=A0A1L7WP17_9HELO|nr:related to HET domain protein [Phialocephala subalpina]